MKRFLGIIIFGIFLSSCQQNWQTSPTNSKLDNDKRYCKAAANASSPIYICTNPLMCKPDETSRVFNSIAKNKGIFNKCMFDKGYFAN